LNGRNLKLLVVHTMHCYDNVKLYTTHAFNHYFTTALHRMNTGRPDHSLSHVLHSDFFFVTSAQLPMRDDCTKDNQSSCIGGWSFCKVQLLTNMYHTKDI